MPAFDNYLSTPIGSLVNRSPEEESRYLDLVGRLPKSLSRMVFSGVTGSFLRGLAKDFGVSPEQSPKLAFAVLQIAVGEVPLAKLGSTLSGELKLPNDKAQAVAREIEKELFTPVMLELNDFLAKQKQGSSAGTAASKAGAQNVVDLKKQQPSRTTPAAGLPKPGQFNT